ncbi:MAG: cysteinyl-tRNA synthetase [Anaerolineae bacterium]|nr:MAG: cysteinyl-tRNA synthetase [Anaerolineae bacterium]
MFEQPGLIVLFGSGETSASGRRVFDWLFRRLPSPVQMAILETPAGFELNSAQVAGRVADFLRHRLQNHCPQVTVVPARKRSTPFSPDNPEIVAPLLGANAVFLGPGSPTYAVRQLRDSLAWHTLVARHRLGAAVVLASAGAIASSAYALPVYEICKVGQDLHWCKGLDFFGAYGLSLAFVSHWNNAEGGAELDTSRCYMGQVRFEPLRDMLPPHVAVGGIDEHTALAIDLSAGTCQVLGKGGVTLLRGGDEQRFESGMTFSINELGRLSMPEPGAGLPPEVWDRAVAAHTEIQRKARQEPPPEMLALVQEREAARAEQDWATADALRGRIATLGWRILDTSQGPQLEPEEGV